MNKPETNERLTYAVVYRDDGPIGVCGQSGITTSPHTRVYLFDTENKMREWIQLNSHNIPKRRNSRLVICYPRGDILNYAYSNGLEWIS